MKKLSEIETNEYIVVDDSERGLMTKKDYLESSEFEEKENVQLYEAKAVSTGTDWDDVIQHLICDQYTGWDEDVLEEINKCSDLQTAMITLNGIFEKYPTYFEGDPIENDMLEDCSP